MLKLKFGLLISWVFQIVNTNCYIIDYIMIIKRTTKGPFQSNPFRKFNYVLRTWSSLFLCLWLTFFLFFLLFLFFLSAPNGFALLTFVFSFTVFKFLWHSRWSRFTSTSPLLVTLLVTLLATTVTLSHFTRPILFALCLFGSSSCSCSLFFRFFFFFFFFLRHRGGSVGCGWCPVLGGHWWWWRSCSSSGVTLRVSTRVYEDSLPNCWWALTITLRGWPRLFRAKKNVRRSFEYLLDEYLL